MASAVRIGLAANLCVAGAAALWADPRCVSCHAAQAANYAQTGMGRSASRPVREAVSSQQVRHTPSAALLSTEWRSGQLIHRLKQSGAEESFPLEWAIGSGNQGKSFLLQAGDALFQSPLSWYTARSAWDLSPGYEADPKIGFFRPVTPDCLFCHTGQPRPRPGTLNRYQNPPFQPVSIGCDRCHGDPAAHLARPVRGTIVNPARLEPVRRASVCEQCHLSGEARIPNPGRRFADFAPGMRLEEVFSVYVPDAPGSPQGLKVVSHSEQLAQSRCYLKSEGRLWCGSCHNPHAAGAGSAVAYRRQCLECHPGPAMRAHAAQRGDGCAACHMPRLRAYDGGHAAFHDHRIRIPGAKPAPAPVAGQHTGLHPWRPAEPEFSNRNLGLAYISAGSRGAPEFLERGFRLLATTKNDAAVDSARGLVLMQSGRPRDAERVFRRALQQNESDSTAHLNLAAALLALNNTAEAAKEAQRAIELEPLLEDAYALMAQLEPERSRYWRERFHNTAHARRP